MSSGIKLWRFCLLRVISLTIKPRLRKGQHKMRLFAFMIFLTVGSVHADPVIAPVKLEVFKSKTCGCCAKWIDHLNEKSFDAVGINLDQLGSFKYIDGDRYVLKHALFLLSFLIFKTVILFFLLLAFKLRSYTAFLITISLSTYSEFSLIILSSWLDAGAINSEILTIVTCSVCLSFIIGSIINSYVHEIYVYFEKYLVVLERKTHHPDEEPHTCGEAQVMIFGMGRIGSSIFQNLHE